MSSLWQSSYEAGVRDPLLYQHIVSTHPLPLLLTKQNQQPNIPGFRGLIDPDTPKAAKTRRGFDGQEYELVFSDEFNLEGRTFWPGDDPYCMFQSYFFLLVRKGFSNKVLNHSLSELIRGSCRYPLLAHRFVTSVIIWYFNHTQMAS